VVGEDARLSRSWDAVHHLGYLPVGFAETFNCLLLTATLFVGPLFEAGIVEGRWRDWIRLRDSDILSSWPGWRNLVAVRPPPLVHLSQSLKSNLSSIHPGTRHGGNPLPLGLRAPPPTLRRIDHHHRLPDAHNLRPRTRPPLLRVSHLAPAHPDHPGRPAVRVAVHLHHAVRRLRDLSIPPHRQLAERHPRARFL
jgi:hypothetical protein